MFGSDCLRYCNNRLFWSDICLCSDGFLWNIKRFKRFSKYRFWSDRFCNDRFWNDRFWNDRFCNDRFWNDKFL